MACITPVDQHRGREVTQEQHQKANVDDVGAQGDSLQAAFAAGGLRLSDHFPCDRGNGEGQQGQRHPNDVAAGEVL